MTLTVFCFKCPKCGTKYEARDRTAPTCACGAGTRRDYQAEGSNVNVKKLWSKSEPI